MLLVKMAIYIFIFAFSMYMAHRVLWLVFFFFNFRFWEIIMTTYANEFFGNLVSIHKFILLTFLAFGSYLLIYFITMKMPLIRYILLAVLFIVAIREYDISDIFLFKDYLEKSGMWGMDYWLEQVKKAFSLKEGQIFNMFTDVLNMFVELFLKVVEEVRKL